MHASSSRNRNSSSTSPAPGRTSSTVISHRRRHRRHRRHSSSSTSQTLHGRHTRLRRRHGGRPSSDGRSSQLHAIDVDDYNFLDVDSHVADDVGVAFACLLVGPGGGGDGGGEEEACGESEELHIDGFRDVK